MEYANIIDINVAYVNEQRIECELKVIKKYQCLIRSVHGLKRNELIGKKNAKTLL